MLTRAADATIKGYYYQFDTTILKILELSKDDEKVLIEGIEDIDIHTATELTTIQCKYLSKPKFINSAIREPVSLMLNHFINPTTPNNLKYILYSHFENETKGNEPTIDLKRLKEILTYKEGKIEKHYEVEKGISDSLLESFLNQFKLIFGTEFYTQQKQVLNKLKGHFNCDDFEADNHFYNNALRIVIDKAIRSDENQRYITKAEFISSIDCRRKLFNEWFIKLRSKNQYLIQSAQNLKSLKVLEPMRTKIILIGNTIINTDNSELPLHSFVENLIEKYYKLNSSLRNAKPLTIILDCDTTTLQDLKKYLIDNEILFNDGFEELKFSPQLFNRDPIINTTTNLNKISKSSYLIKLISRETFRNNISFITAPSIFMIFSAIDIPEKFATGQLFDFKYCETLKDIFKVLAP